MIYMHIFWLCLGLPLNYTVRSFLGGLWGPCVVLGNESKSAVCKANGSFTVFLYCTISPCI